MSYSMVSIVYGTYIDDKVARAIDALGLDPEDCGFTELYDDGGYDHPIGFCGVELGEFDECQLALQVSSLNLLPTSAQGTEAQNALAQLDPSILKVVPKLDVYLVFHSS